MYPGDEVNYSPKSESRKRLKLIVLDIFGEYMPTCDETSECQLLTGILKMV